MMIFQPRDLILNDRYRIEAQIGVQRHTRGVVCDANHTRYPGLITAQALSQFSQASSKSP